MSNVRSMRFIPVALAIVLLAVSAGCGESGSTGGAASAVPEDVAAYVSVDTTFERDQWQAASELLARFPDGEGALEEVLDEKDLRDALGPEAVVAVLPGPVDAGGTPPVVMLTQPDDTEAFDRLLEGSDAARAEMRGWQVVAESEEALDRYREALEGPSLEGSEAFAEAMDDLPQDALARLYANGEALLEAIPQLGQSPLGLVQGQAGGSIGAALRPEAEGIRIEGRVAATEEAPAPEAYESELVRKVPAGAIAFLSFNDLGGALELLGGDFLPLGLGEVGSLLAGESAIYLNGKGDATLVTQVEDEAAALRAVEALLGLAGEDLPVAVDAFDGVLAVSSSERELAALRGDGPRLADDDRFQKAVDAAGMPVETAGFGYVHLPSAAPFFHEEATEASEYLEPLGGAVVWRSLSEDGQRFSLFLGVE
jgi:Protein of unknown function (DUF3352)